jgi:hypothetical protein
VKEEGMSAVVPIGIPGRGELWHRHQLVRAVLNQRPPDAATVSIALCALDGAPIETLMRPTSAPSSLGFVVDWQQIARDTQAACALRGVSQKRLARALGVGSSTVRRILRGQRLTAEVLVSVVAWLYPEEPRPRWIVSASVKEAI